MSRPTRLPLAASAALLLLATACAGSGPAVRTAPSAAVSGASASSATAGASLEKQLEEAAASIDRALAAAQAGDMATAKKEYVDFDDAWEDGIEDPVRERARDVYRAIEGTMDEVREVLVKITPPDREASIAALGKLRQVVDEQRPRIGA